MADKDYKQGPAGQGQKTDITTGTQMEKIEISIEHVVRIYPKDFEAIFKSFQAWADNWED